MALDVACFLFLNVLVAAIAVTSRSRAQHQQGGRAASTTRRQLCRSASSMVLDRLRSFAKHRSVEFC
ncbi:hypothetical protein BDA96_07G131700 [Sorghum bicolor]|jgi:hypothetical protein|uniref:Secreted protein n=2 Tax=Sorghum bicolor TaxID=4558 RepID=A0A921U9S5_SORBI|nr:hypothetical protein BDA96_07G131700 [Sorghum bicolor]OQU80405.1 hypothetical protein SORBI_3007G122866 [Sorghum bicolor]